MSGQAIKRINLNAVISIRPSNLIDKIAKQPQVIAEAAAVADSLANGYSPKGYGLADFSIIRYNQAFHLFHIPRVPGNACTHPANEHWLGHAVSHDCDTWTTLDPVLCIEPKNYFESSHVWAPFVYEHNGQHYMFYTGLSAEPSQVLCIAKSMDTGLRIWERWAENPIVPLNGFDWHWKNHNGHVRHARDPHVVKVKDHYLLAYTAMHCNGCPAVGGLVSSDLRQWEDIGPILFRPMPPASWLPESVNIQPLPENKWALIPSQSPGLEYYISDDPYHWHNIKPRQIEYADGPKEQPVAIEVISRDKDGKWLVGYFESYNNRLFIGELDTLTHPWTLTRIRQTSGLKIWLEYCKNT